MRHKCKKVTKIKGGLEILEWAEGDHLHKYCYEKWVRKCGRKTTIATYKFSGNSLVGI